MQKTPSSSRITIAVFGRRNAGKSSLINALTGQEAALVSPVKGTTTDPVRKAMELKPLGPVLFVDTAGLDDEGELGSLRTARSKRVIEQTDFAIYIVDGGFPENPDLESTREELQRFNVPHIVLINKVDLLDQDEREKLKKYYPGALMVSCKDGTGIKEVKDSLITNLKDKMEESPLLADLIPAGGMVVLVVPIDEAAPKGRLILPQSQTIRECLDFNISCCVLKENNLEETLEELPRVDLVVTDSQVFKMVEEIVPPSIPLTSFSILFARYKGDLKGLVAGAQAIERLEEGASILMAECCTHNVTHEDIGRVKIPGLLQKRTGKKFDFSFAVGPDFPNTLASFQLVIHCGGCMVNRKTVKSRLKICKEAGVPITNYGVILAYLNGILDQVLEPFESNSKLSERA